ncbi:MAG: Fic family protein [Gammaproteobacteria bacterium]|nr:Fic family protein [Gammaproteobacteria bacterium]
MRFLEGLDDDIRQGLLDRIKTSWTHHSTAIEGNSLSLFDTRMLIEEGLTVGGKTLREHQEVVGHARCVELIYGLLGRAVGEEDLFILHKAVQVDAVFDICKPMGAWKREPNGVYVPLPDGRERFHEFARPADVPALMGTFILEMNKRILGAGNMDADASVAAYAQLHAGFVSVHPFWDGNGRLARLVSNLPMLSAGFPPILIDKGRRGEYMRHLADYQEACGPVTPESGPWPAGGSLDAICGFFADCHAHTLEWIREAHELQDGRDSSAQWPR